MHPLLKSCQNSLLKFAMQDTATALQVVPCAGKPLNFADKPIELCHELCCPNYIEMHLLHSVQYLSHHWPTHLAHSKSSALTLQPIQKLFSQSHLLGISILGTSGFGMSHDPVTWPSPGSLPQTKDLIFNIKLWKGEITHNPLPTNHWIELANV